MSETETTTINALLIENDQVCIDVIMSIFAESSIRVTICHTLEDALEAMKNSKPDVVLLDNDALSPMKKALKDVPMVIFTSKDYIERAKRWITAEDRSSLQSAVYNAAGRKNAFERMSAIMERMRKRWDDMGVMVEKAVTSAKSTP